MLHGDFFPLTSNRASIGCHAIRLCAAARVAGIVVYDLEVLRNRGGIVSKLRFRHDGSESDSAPDHVRLANTSRALAAIETADGSQSFRAMLQRGLKG